MQEIFLSGLLLVCCTMTLTGCQGKGDTGKSDEPIKPEAATEATTKQETPAAAPKVITYQPRVAVEGEWPTQFGSNIDQPVTLTTPDGKSIVLTVKKIEYTFEPDYLTNKTPDNKTYLSALLTLDVEGQPVVLTLRGYQMPVTVGNVRLSVEQTRPWMEQFVKGSGWDIPVSPCEVVFSAVPAGQTWGPADYRFPLQNYRWRSSTYRNSWSALVPFNTLYYHQGEDFGAIPNKVNIQVPYPGTVIKTPLPDGDEDSNKLEVGLSPGVTNDFYHMNIETIDPAMQLGAKVVAGQYAAQTGETWERRKSQGSDPHVHIGFNRNGIIFNGYATLIEAYFRDHEDAAIAIAGGFGFVNLGDSYMLDGTRSLARPGKKIKSYQWILHDGTVVDGPITSVKFTQMGYFAEELRVITEDGFEDRDAIHIHVFDPANRNWGTAAGWAYSFPSRDVQPGQEITFWRRLSIDADASIDFGDGTSLVTNKAEFTHAYTKPGIYTVSIQGLSGPNKESILHKLRVVVDGPKPATVPAVELNK